MRPLEALKKGAETAVWLVNEDQKGVSGRFFRDMEEISCN